VCVDGIAKDGLSLVTLSGGRGCLAEPSGTISVRVEDAAVGPNSKCPSGEFLNQVNQL
jgi:hypothetical protein